jgi:hypothetical protein
MPLIAPPLPTVAAWCSPDDVTDAFPAFTGGNGTLDGVDLRMIVDAATDLLFRRSGRQWRGVHTSVVRPARLSGSCGCLPYPWGSFAYGSGFGWGGWAGFGAASGSWPQGWDCRCPPANELVLQGPVIQVSEVLVDGVALADNQMALYGHRRLVRANPTGPGEAPGWPCCQNLSLPPTQAGTWQVTYDWGAPPPALGRLAAIELSCELALRWSRNQACRLPAQATNLVREGVSVTIGTPLAFAEKGLTGLPTVDEFLMAVNPYGLQRRAKVYSPDSIVRHTT